MCRLIRRAVERGVQTTFVIYTGYTKCEVQRLGFFDELKGIGSGVQIVMKYGRYVPGQQPHFDEALSVDLASDNQYGESLTG